MATRPVKLGEQLAWDGTRRPPWWCLVDETWNPAVRRWAAAWSPVALSPDSSLTGYGKGWGRPRWPPRSRLHPGLSLAASAELILSLFLTVISDDSDVGPARDVTVDWMSAVVCKVVVSLGADFRWGARCNSCSHLILGFTPTCVFARVCVRARVRCETCIL